MSGKYVNGHRFSMPHLSRRVYITYNYIIREGDEASDPKDGFSYCPPVGRARLGGR
jgi:hypothetical protein